MFSYILFPPSQISYQISYPIWCVNVYSVTRIVVICKKIKYKQNLTNWKLLYLKEIVNNNLILNNI